MSDDFAAVSGGVCELCGRVMPQLTRHHLIPRTRHRKKRTQRTFERSEMKERLAMLCRPCHRHIHAVIDNKELESDYNTLEALAAHPEVSKFTEWIKKKPPGTTVPVRKQK
jgi:5-methylcytosine-specific restriction endonuclease McrA